MQSLTKDEVTSQSISMLQAVGLFKQVLYHSVFLCVFNFQLSCPPFILSLCM